MKKIKNRNAYEGVQILEQKARKSCLLIQEKFKNKGRSAKNKQQ